jgi:hypothetical protein
MEHTKQSPVSLNPFAIAGALIAREPRTSLTFYLILLVPLVLRHSGVLENLPHWFLSGAVHRFFEILFLFVAGSYLLQSISCPESKRLAFTKQRMSFLLLLFFGFSFWLMSTIPVQIISGTYNTSIKLGMFFVSGAAIYLGLRYYFYFVPIVLGIKDPLKCLQFAASITQGRVLLSLLVMFAPMTIMFFLKAVVHIASPDGRIAAVSILAEAFDPVYWFLSTYLAFSFAAVFMADPLRVPAEIGKDLHLRLAAIEGNSPAISRFLKPKNCGLLLVVTISLGLANLFRLFSLPPGPDILVEEISIKKNALELVLYMEDEKYNFRGFMPQALILAGEHGSIVSRGTSIVKAVHNGEISRSGIKTGEKEVLAVVRFATELNENSLRSLEDLYLWYFGTRLKHLQTSEARPLAD